MLQETDVMAALGVVLDGPLAISGYRIDSRLVEPGDLFFALKGARSDGHSFLQEVKQKGALAAVVSKGYRGPDQGLVLIPVEDVEESLAQLARLSLDKKKVFLIGISGSVGKTTTKEFVATLLEGKYRVAKSWGNQNSRLSLPLAILNRREEAEVLILEMGMGAPGDLSRLVQIAPPDMALLTRVSLAHAAFFPGGIGEIARNKWELFSHPQTKVALFDADIEGLCPELPPLSCKRVTFSVLNRQADLFSSYEKEQMFIDEKGIRVHQCFVPFSATHILHNLMGAVAIAREMKMSWSEIERRIPFLVLPKMRFELVERGGALFYNDAYNASPASVSSALFNLPLPQLGGKRVAVLGEMRELGSFSKQAHREVGLMAQQCVDHLLAVGEETRPMYEAFLEAKKPSHWFASRDEAGDFLSSLVRPGDVVLIKGSRSLEMDKLFERIG